MKTHLLYCINAGTLCTVHSIPYSSDVGSGCHVYTLRVPIFEIADDSTVASDLTFRSSYFPVQNSGLFRHC